ncbi:MAG: squalene/phytoene synthase family protein, partial [Pseudomonadota bacterium]
HNLPLETFQAYLDARIFDLYNDPMPDMGSFEGYLGETRAALYQMIAFVAGLTRSSELADACGHTGMAIGLAQLIRQTGKHRAKHQLFFPETILQEAGLEADAWFADQINARHLRVLEEISQIAQSHYQQALGAIKQLPIESRAVFLPLTLVPKLLQKLRKSPESCLTQPLTLSRLTVHWTYLRSDKQFSR